MPTRTTSTATTDATTMTNLLKFKAVIENMPLAFVKSVIVIHLRGTYQTKDESLSTPRLSLAVT
jgi:hypothetical protein